ncbi:class I SAM-dependent methyltransferase [Caulobacter sp. BK020]|uniref:class I SAM-dependent methyltransferase n=1 Tax=Caulobacter sp. BK020 TaxID=2512117 RepID=UPI001053AE22|nr:class I SAM-dependent methyltransferase [Caulobacter sp. BK020]TCS10429.1 hypothetical protein EV278_11710 [Caulobacter sp. BK020]
MAERRSTPEDVYLCYRMLLGREPEYPQAMIARAMQYPSRTALVSSFIHTLEFQLRLGAPICPGLDVALMAEFADPEAVGVEGFVTDFMGGITHTSLLAWALERNGQLEMAPVLGNLFGSLPEWLSVLGAVKDAVDRGRGRFAVAEIGAGWGPWLAVAGRAARRKGLGDLRLIGVEPAPELCASMKRHLSDNGFDASVVTLVEAAVVPGAQAAQHPMLAHPSLEFGHRSTARPVKAPPADGWRAVETITLGEVMALEPELDLLVLTTGGEEAAMLAEVDLTTLKARSLMAATHDRQTDFTLWDRLSKAGWRNAIYQPCEVRQDSDDLSVTHIVRDGCQYWVNPRL